MDCTLALLVNQRFTVLDRMPKQRASATDPENRSSSIASSVVVVSLVLAAAGGLVYGAATCDFPGCKAVFGVPLVLGGSFMLLAIAND